MTIGYEATSLEEFFDALAEHSIEVLVDARENPFSFKRGFSKRPLPDRALSLGLKYDHRRELGNPAYIRSEFKSSGDINAALSQYRHHLETYPAVIQRLRLDIRGRRAGIMCLERNYKMRHRSVIAEKLEDMTRWHPVHLIGKKPQRSLLAEPIPNRADATSKQYALEL